MTPLDPADWTFPVPVAFGPGRLRELGQACQSLGMSKPLVVTDGGSAELPFVAAALDSIARSGLDRDLFAKVSPNPTNVDVAAGRTAFRSGGHDGVVAIGGGSGMDAGKAISLVAANKYDLWSFDYDLGPSPDLNQSADDRHGLVPLITVPTTAGTGAETESTAMITDVEAAVKRCVWHAEHKPSLALLDPVLTIGLPQNLTAWTGVDALVHAIEAFSVDAWHPMCDGTALEAMRMIASSLPQAVADGDNLEARSTMLVGSCLAGVAFLKGLGLVHALSHMIGAVHDTHHGLTNAVLLPSVLRFNREALGPKVAAMTAALGADGASFEALDSWIVELLDALDIQRSLGAIGVGAESVDDIAAKAMGDAAAATNPRPVTLADATSLLNDALVAAR